MKWFDRVKSPLVSDPMKYADTIMMNQEIGTNSKCISLCEKWTKYTNIKVILIDTREGPSTFYPDFIFFTA